MTATIPETTIQQVLFEVETPYLGHPYFVTGHALYTALARRVNERTRQALCVSNGVFLPGEYGAYPEAHSQRGPAGSMGTELQPVESYADLFLFRDPAQRWLLDSRPRDAHNAHDLQRHGNRVAFAPGCWFGRPSHVRNTKRSVSWYLHCYLHADGPDAANDAVLPLDDDVLDGIRLGGARNYGFGATSLADSRTVDLQALDYSRLQGPDVEAYRIELVTPYVLASAHPAADDQQVPWWWDVDAFGSGDGDVDSNRQGLRRREERLVRGADQYDLATIDHGQVVGYTGDDPIRTAINGVRRVGTHSKFGFGEFRVRPAGDDRVPERAQIAPERDDRGGDGAGVCVRAPDRGRR